MSSETRNYSFFQNRSCEYFPCHEGIDEADFNCLFCFCPLYALGSECGGNCRFDKDGNKDCSGCAVPHGRGNYDRIVARYDDICRIISEREKK